MNGSVGWQLDDRGVGIGRHFSDKHQDPTMFKPSIPGSFYRTTLVEGNDKKWYVMELCEKLEELVQLDSEFHGMRGRRNIITFITDAEKDPLVLGFSLVDADEPGFPVRPEAEADVDIPVDEQLEVVGQDVPEGRIVVQASPEDEVNVNGILLRASSGLAALRAGCVFYGISTSGSKSKSRSVLSVF